MLYNYQLLQPRGVILLQKNKVQEGIFYLRKAVAFPVEIDDDPYCRKGACQQLGSALEGTGDISGAKEAYFKALKMDPGNAELKICLEKLLRR